MTPWAKQNGADRYRQNRKRKRPGTNIKTRKARRGYDLENNVYKKNITEKRKPRVTRKVKKGKDDTGKPSQGKEAEKQKNKGRKTRRATD